MVLLLKLLVPWIVILYCIFVVRKEAFDTFDANLYTTTLLTIGVVGTIIIIVLRLFGC